LVWKADGVIFLEDTGLAESLRFKKHPNGHLVEIYYGIERRWSKSVRDREDRRLLKEIAGAAADLMHGDRFAWVANKDVPGGLFKGLPADPRQNPNHPICPGRRRVDARGCAVSPAGYEG
jgi:hypothetical protein